MSARTSEDHDGSERECNGKTVVDFGCDEGCEQTGGTLSKNFKLSSAKLKVSVWQTRPMLVHRLFGRNFASGREYFSFSNQCMLQCLLNRTYPRCYKHVVLHWRRPSTYALSNFFTKN